MATISGTTSSNYTSSLYNSANIVSGLASGMDTEGMIESLVQSYSTKIQELTNKATKIEWKMDSYRSIISKMYAFSNKYTSYTSSSNLASQAFFESARLVTPQGANADKVAASGRTSSDVVLNSVSQMATSARYITSGNLAGAGDGTAITASKALDLNSNIDMGKLQGSLSLLYGNKTVSITFNENDDQYKNAGELANAIQEKLKEQTITLSDGSSAKASDRINVSVDANGVISFSEKGSAGNSVYISGASGSVAEELGLKDVTSSDKVTEVRAGNKSFIKQVTAAEYISGKQMNINLDGTTKTVYTPKIEKNSDGTFTLTMPTTKKDSNGQSVNTYEGGTKYENVSKEDLANKYTELLSQCVEKSFGSKVRVTNEGTYDGDTQLRLKFETDEGSNLLINTDAGDVLNIGKTSTNYLNTSKTLGELGVDFKGLEPVYEGEEGTSNRKFLGYRLSINGEEIGVYNSDSKLSEIISDINSNKEAGVKVSYSQTTRSFVFETRDTGSEQTIDIKNGDLAASIFGSTEFSEVSSGSFGEAYGVSWLNGDKVTIQYGDGLYLDVNVGNTDTMEDVADKINKMITGGYTASYDKYTGELAIRDKNGAKIDYNMSVDDEDLGHIDLKLKDEYKPKIDYTPGQDAKFTVTVNGIQKEMTRGTNTVDIDGLSLTFKDTFENDGSGVSFKVTTDADKIVDAVKSMVADYNEMISEIKSAYATMPYQNSSGVFQDYEPLSAEDQATMSESAIQAYEAKAKQGILFGDSNLKSLYQNLYNVFNPSGTDNSLLQKMGLTMSYSSDGSSYLTLDENKLRDVLESDPDSVMNIFTRTAETGGTSGLMEGLKTQLDRYGATTGAVKGILVQQSGTPLSSLSLLDNEWQKQIDSLGTQIEKWQDKLSGRVDYYTSMFSKLELLINQMNSQSATLAGMMGG